MTLPIVRLGKYEWRRIRSGHPWIYPKSIRSVPDRLETGDLVQVLGPREESVGVAVYHPGSKIRLRVLTTEVEVIDQSFFEKRLQTALFYRKKVLPGSNSFRLINSESDGLSGLIIDVYERAVLFQITSAGLEKLKTSIIAAIDNVLDPEILIERNDVANRKFEGLPEHKEVHKTPPNVSLNAYPATIDSVQYELDLWEGNKTGLYLDQIQNHTKFSKLLEQFPSKRVLDCFSYVGGFSIRAAMNDQVEEVVGLDQSAECVAKAELHAKLNNVDSKCEFIKTNVFDWLREKASGIEPENQFDVIILDPPSFTKNRHAVEGAIRGYRELHVRALKLLKPGGLLFTYSCSHHISDDLLRSIAFESACDTQNHVYEIESHRQSLDHPINPSIPESYYLKGFVYFKKEG